MDLVVYESVIDKDELNWLEEHNNLVQKQQISNELLFKYNQALSSFIESPFRSIEWDSISPPTTYLHAYYKPIVCFIILDDNVTLQLYTPTHPELRQSQVILKKSHFYLIKNLYCNSFILRPDKDSEKRANVIILRTKTSNF